MSPRRVTALLCVIAAALMLFGAFSHRWLVADVRSPQLNGALRIGLTSVSTCVATVEVTRCQSIEWSQVPGCSEGSSWMWLGRLTFGLALIAAAVLVGLAVIAGADLDVRLPLSAPRVVMWACGAVLPLMGGYYLLTPSFLGAGVSAGRGFAFAGLGVVIGLVAAARDSDPF